MSSGGSPRSTRARTCLWSRGSASRAPCSALPERLVDLAGEMGQVPRWLWSGQGWCFQAPRGRMSGGHDMPQDAFNAQQASSAPARCSRSVALSSASPASKSSNVTSSPGGFHVDSAWQSLSSNGVERAAHLDCPAGGKSSSFRGDRYPTRMGRRRDPSGPWLQGLAHALGNRPVARLRNSTADSGDPHSCRIGEAGIAPFPWIAAIPQDMGPHATHDLHHRLQGPTHRAGAR